MSLRIRRRQVVEADEAALRDSQVPPLPRRILAARGIARPEEVLPGLGALPEPGLMKGMDEAVALLLEHRKGRILIIGDFDADGATSCALLLRALPAMDFAHVDFLVPNRFEFGYGLSPEIVALAAERRPDLVITVDNGISSIEGVAAAHRAGIPVVITDHHLPGAELPAADAIINPARPDCGFPGKSLAGVGVAFYLALAVRAALREQQAFGPQCPEPRLDRLLDLVALGTVADVVPLDGINRTLVHEGLRRIRAGRACPGILALLDVAGRDRPHLVATDLGFAVAPRLNAAGRLEDISCGIECLVTDDPDVAQRGALVLDEMNGQRREIEAQMRQEADQVLAEREPESDSLPPALCLHDPDWHQGVVGIVASRLKDRHHRPVIVFAREKDDSGGQAVLKGSARSVPGFHIRDALEAVATARPGLISRFGGHAMAAGLSLPAAHLDTFREAFIATARQWLGDAAGDRDWVTDGALSLDVLTLETAQTLRELAPWGQGFPEPLFDGEFELHEQRIVGEKHLKMQVSPANGGEVLDAIAFNVDLSVWPEPAAGSVRLVYRLDINRFRGRTRLQLLVQALERL